jgi:hypothetical protein
VSDTFVVERQSRLVSLVYQVLGTIELPALDASDGEVLEVLASAFLSKAQIAVEEARHARRKRRPTSQHPSMVSSSYL